MIPRVAYLRPALFTEEHDLDLINKPVSMLAGFFEWLDRYGRHYDGPTPHYLCFGGIYYRYEVGKARQPLSSFEVATDEYYNVRIHVHEPQYA